MTKAERLKLIQLGLPHIITKPQQEEIQEQQKFTIEIIDRLSDYSDKQLEVKNDLLDIIRPL
jgi:cell division GTPase FtsZ